jgi:hypothetical protein
MLNLPTTHGSIYLLDPSIPVMEGQSVIGKLYSIKKNGNTLDPIKENAVSLKGDELQLFERIHKDGEGWTLEEVIGQLQILMNIRQYNPTHCDYILVPESTNVLMGDPPISLNTLKYSDIIFYPKKLDDKVVARSLGYMLSILPHDFQRSEIVDEWYFQGREMKIRELHKGKSIDFIDAIINFDHAFLYSNHEKAVSKYSGQNSDLVDDVNKFTVAALSNPINIVYLLASSSKDKLASFYEVLDLKFNQDTHSFKDSTNALANAYAYAVASALLFGDDKIIETKTKLEKVFPTFSDNENTHDLTYIFHAACSTLRNPDMVYMSLNLGEFKPQNKTYAAMI